MKKLIIVLSLVLIVVAATSAYAQGNGRNDTAPGQNCASGDTQCQAFNHGGIGFVNGRNGARWNENERGNMRNGQGSNGIGYYAQLPPATAGDLTDAQIAAMVDGWMDEQHAYAVYGAIIDQFGAVAPFVNIHCTDHHHQRARRDTRILLREEWSGTSLFPKSGTDIGRTAPV